jgi:hypothetical protein
VSRKELESLQALGKEVLEKGELLFPKQIDRPNGHGVGFFFLKSIELTINVGLG